MVHECPQFGEEIGGSRGDTPLVEELLSLSLGVGERSWDHTLSALIADCTCLLASKSKMKQQHVEHCARM